MKKYLFSICLLGILLVTAMPSKAGCNPLEEACVSRPLPVELPCETCFPKVLPRQDCDNPESSSCGGGLPLLPEFPAEQRNIKIPSLNHFTVSDYEVNKDFVYLQFAPNGSPRFYLHVQLESVNGKDELAAWCTGDESLCKAVGNGQACTKDLPTGNGAWFYVADKGKEELSFEDEASPSASWSDDTRACEDAKSCGDSDEAVDFADETVDDFAAMEETFAATEEAKAESNAAATETAEMKAETAPSAAFAAKENVSKSIATAP